MVNIIHLKFHFELPKQFWFWVSKINNAWSRDFFFENAKILASVSENRMFLKIEFLRLDDKNMFHMSEFLINWNAETFASDKKILLLYLFRNLFIKNRFWEKLSLLCFWKSFPENSLMLFSPHNSNLTVNLKRVWCGKYDSEKTNGAS